MIECTGPCHSCSGSLTTCTSCVSVLRTGSSCECPVKKFIKKNHFGSIFLKKYYDFGYSKVYDRKKYIIKEISSFFFN